MNTIKHLYVGVFAQFHIIDVLANKLAQHSVYWIASTQRIDLHLSQGQRPQRKELVFYCIVSSCTHSAPAGYCRKHNPIPQAEGVGEAGFFIFGFMTTGAMRWIFVTSLCSGIPVFLGPQRTSPSAGTRFSLSRGVTCLFCSACQMQEHE